MELKHVRAAHLRFGYSAGRETLRAIAVLSAPARHAEQHEWLRVARPRVSSAVRNELRYFSFFFKPTTEILPALWPAQAATDFETDVTKLQAGLREYVDAIVVRLSGERLISPERLAEIRKPSWYKRAARNHARHNPSTGAMLAGFTSSPRASLDRFVKFLRAFYADVMEPLIGPIHALLARDIEMRGAMMRSHGYVPALRMLSKGISVIRSRTSECTIRAGAQDGVSIKFTNESTLTLTPSYFTWPDVQIFALRRPGGPQCSIVYPLPALPDRTAKVLDRAVEFGVLSALADPLRIRIVELLSHRELSTRELAVFLDSSEPVISRHLRILTEAGALVSRRSGYFVLYGLRREALHQLGETLLRL